MEVFSRLLCAPPSSLDSLPDGFAFAGKFDASLEFFIGNQKEEGETSAAKPGEGRGVGDKLCPNLGNRKKQQQSDTDRKRLLVLEWGVQKK